MASYIFQVAFLVTFLSLHVSAESIEGLAYVTKFSDKHYWQYTQPLTQEGAKEFCRSIGFDLVQFDSAEEIDHLKSELGSNDYWTSGVGIATNSRFHWDLAWNEKNPVAMDVADITSYSGIYLTRTGSLRTTELTVSMRPLCQHVVNPECVR